ncbi:hypothetical protein [Pseudomonas saponiphila]|uniref:hypothetical protein n=1 Tax=Pseudomonas saponiphila TaxID=556534 RepID=UPI0022404848|nr:hypothetical protein [Pseudomonas saponiphila]
MLKQQALQKGKSQKQKTPVLRPGLLLSMRIKPVACFVASRRSVVLEADMAQRTELSFST